MKADVNREPETRRKTILCYGDSNTYGYDPVSGKRLPEGVRWTSRLKELLGPGYKVIEEGCNGRTTVFKEPGAEWKNGLEYLKPCLNSHKPVDLVILMLGTNDLKTMFHAAAKDAAAGAERLVQIIREFTLEKQGSSAKILLVSPPEIGAGITESPFRDSFDATAPARSKEFPRYYREVAGRNGCIFFDAARAASPSVEDSLHLMPEEHRKLAEALCFYVKDKL